MVIVVVVVVVVVIVVVVVVVVAVVLCNPWSSSKAYWWSGRWLDSLVLVGLVVGPLDLGRVDDWDRLLSASVGYIFGFTFLFLRFAGAGGNVL